MDKVWDELISALQCLPHVGVKSAQRIAFSLLAHRRENAEKLALAINRALGELKHCALCSNFTHEELCPICRNQERNHSLLCIVESPIDLAAIEQTRRFDGVYYVLMGALSPIEGIGPREIGFEKLRLRIINSQTPISEVLLATNFTNEGEATAHALSEMLLRQNIRITRLAHGVPVGGELEYLDVGTIAQALISRKNY